MDIAIYGLVTVATISGLIFTAAFSSHKSLAAWSLFTTILASALAFTLTWQKSIWDKEAAESVSSTQLQEAARNKGKPEGLTEHEQANSATNTAEAPGGLKFREVSPRQLGIEPPKTFQVDFGTNVRVFGRQILENQVPFEQMSVVSFGGKLPLGISINKDGELKINATVYEANGEIGAVIKDSEFTILNARWDRNWDATAFEIVDEHTVPFFQIERYRENAIKIRGIFRTSANEVIVSTDSQLVMNPTRPVPGPTSLFKYPSNNNLHQRKR